MGAGVGVGVWVSVLYIIVSEHAAHMRTATYMLLIINVTSMSHQCYVYESSRYVHVVDHLFPALFIECRRALVVHEHCLRQG